MFWEIQIDKCQYSVHPHDSPLSWECSFVQWPERSDSCTCVLWTLSPASTKAHSQIASSISGRWHFWWKERGHASHITKRSSPSLLQIQHSSSFLWFSWGWSTCSEWSLSKRGREECTKTLTSSSAFGLHCIQLHMREWIIRILAWKRQICRFTPPFCDLHFLYSLLEVAFSLDTARGR